MDYQTACRVFENRYKREASKRRQSFTPKMNDREILLSLSIAQKELAETYRLAKRLYRLSLVDNQFRYAVGTETNTIPLDILDIDLIVANPNETFTSTIIVEGSGGYGTSYGVSYGDSVGASTSTSTTTTSGSVGTTNYPAFIERASMADISDAFRQGGAPSKWAYFDADDSSELWINSLPSEDSKLLLVYHPRMYLFGENSNDTTNPTWSDYDENEPDYGGSFKLLNMFHSLIIDCALATEFPDLTEMYLLKVREMVKRRPRSHSFRLHYHLGDS